MASLRRYMFTLMVLFIVSMISAAACYAAGASINSQDVELFAVSSAYEGSKLPAIPENKKSFQLKISGAEISSCYIKSGESVTVTSKGLIKPATCIWYWKNGYATTFKPDDLTGYTIEEDIITGESEIVVRTTAGDFTVKAEVIDYAQYYADGIIDEIIAENITDSMSNEEKIKAATKWVADNTDYSVSYQSYVDMIIFESGDCWASANTISEICKKLGMKAWTRNGNKDSGSGSGHRNGIIYADGIYYIAEAGFAGTRPRSWYVTKRSTAFSIDETTGLYNGGYTLAQYDGDDKDHNVLTVPGSIDGDKITAIGESFGLRSPEQDSWTEVIIEEGIEALKKSAFNSSYNLEKITIPSTVTSIGDFALCNCPKLKDITIAEGNSVFKEEKGVVYTKDGKTLLICPGRDSAAIPDTVETISKYAFYYNKSISKLVIPASVKTVGEGAFCVSGIKELYFEGDMPAFDKYVFGDLNVTVYYPKDNATWDTSDSYNATSIKWVACSMETEHVARKDATCTEAGNIEHWTKFGRYYSDEACTAEIAEKDIVIPATGHSFSDWEVVQEPTDTEPGSKTRVCGRCGEKETEVIPKLTPDQLPNTLKASAKTQKIKYSALKKKTQTRTAKKVFTVKSPQGKVTYKVAKYDKKAKKKITVSKSGKLTVKKGLKKGTYKIRVKVAAAGTSAYLPKSLNTTLKVVVR